MRLIKMKLEPNDIPTPVADPIVSDDDKMLLDKARRSVAILQVEIKTVIGFASDYLTEKYNIKDQEQFNRLFGDF